MGDRVGAGVSGVAGLEGAFSLPSGSFDINGNLAVHSMSRDDLSGGTRDEHPHGDVVFDGEIETGLPILAAYRQRFRCSQSLFGGVDGDRELLQILGAGAAGHHAC